MAKTKTSDKGKRKTSSTDKGRGKRKSENSDDFMIIMPLGEHDDLIVPFLMDFLDVPTLVSLGSTNKKNQGHLSEQVARRKSRFQAIKNKISNELLSADNLMPSREKVHQTLRLRQEACRLVESGLRRVDHEFAMDDYDFTSACSVCSRDRLFADESKLLNAHRDGNALEHLLMLPTAFLSFQESYLRKGSYSGWHASFRRADQACHGRFAQVSCVSCGCSGGSQGGRFSRICDRFAVL
jgi:hypothetical protein